nr:DEAD/DEAH box helicase family protein [Alteripontixanthobacter muriae]
MREPHGRALISMAAGTGKLVVVLELLADLLQSKEVGVALVLAGTAAEREQIFAALSREFGDVVAQRTQGNEISLERPRIVVGSVSQLSKIRHGYGQDFLVPREAVSHLIFSNFGPRSAPSLRPISEAFYDARIAAITSISPNMGVGAGRSLKKLMEVFEEFHFIYGADYAVEDGWLRPSRIVRRSTDDVIPSNRNLTTRGGFNIEGVTSAVRQFSDDISESETANGSRVLICKDLETATFSSELVDRWLEDEEFATRTGLARTLAISSYSYDRNMANALLDAPGTLLCMTPGIASSADWSRVGIVGLLAAVEDTLAQDLQFTPQYGHSARDPLVVLDYVDSLQPRGGGFLKR